MSTATLKKSLGEGGAFIDESYGAGEDNLHTVMSALSNQGDSLSAFQATPTTGIKESIVLDSAARIGTLYARIGDAGSANSTSIRVRKNGTLMDAAFTITFANTDNDDSFLGVEIDDEGAAGDLYQIEFTAVATDAAGLSATLRVKNVTVEP